MKQEIQTALAPQAIGPYSQAIKVANVVYFSGQIPLVPQTMDLVGDEIDQQVSQTLKNLQAVAKAAGGELNKIVKLTVYLIDLNDFPIFNQIMAKFFTEPYPARVTIQVAALPKAAKIEIDAIMVV